MTLSTPGATRLHTPWGIVYWGVMLMQAAKANNSELPRCEPRELHFQKFAVQTLAEGEPSSLPLTRPGCPFERPSYECGPHGPPRQYMTADNCRLDPWQAGSTPFAPGSHVLVTGNSFARQVFQTLLCQYSNDLLASITRPATAQLFLPLGGPACLERPHAAGLVRRAGQEQHRADSTVRRPAHG